MSLKDDAQALATDADLRTANRRLLQKLEKAKASKEELVEAVYRAALDAASTMTIPSIAAPKVGKGKSEEVAICLLADWQAGKTTPDYDSSVTGQRVRRYAEKVTRIIELQRSHHPVNEAHIFLLGDLLEGEEIFPGQAHRIDASLYNQVFSTAELLAEVVRTVAASVPKVIVKGAIGNHGAMGGPVRRSYHPETNFDAMLYNIARMLCKDESRIEWDETRVAGERAWYATDEVLGKRWFLFHGDQVKSASFGIPWYGFNKRLLGWATSVAPFDYSASGHWHTPVRMQVNAITHWGAGSPESANTFAQEFLAAGGQRPSQWLLFANARGVTSEWCVYLDD